MYAVVTSCISRPSLAFVRMILLIVSSNHHAAAVGVITETNAEKAIEELKAYEVPAPMYICSSGPLGYTRG